jgi:Tol biopolymer transport system component
VAVGPDGVLPKFRTSNHRERDNVMNKPRFVTALFAVGIAASAWSQDVEPVEKCDPAKAHCVPAIAFTSTRDGNGEIYLMMTNEDGTIINTLHPIRVTDNAVGDGFPQLSPDGKRIVFDSNREIPGLPTYISDLFVMKADGKDQTKLTRGSSATWSPDGKYIAFHRSASGDTCPPGAPAGTPLPGCPIKVDPGAATFDSDIFVMRIPDLDGNFIAEPTMTNITNSQAYIDDDPNWSPDGQKIVFTRHHVNDNQLNSITAEICVLNLETGEAECHLGDNGEEERAPVWSPDGTRIAYMCRSGIQVGDVPGTAFEICVMNADGTGRVQVTDNSVFEATGSWSLDGTKIVFQRLVPLGQQLWVMNADGTDQTQLTSPPGINLFPKWGVLRVQ